MAAADVTAIIGNCPRPMPQPPGTGGASAPGAPPAAAAAGAAPAAAAAPLAAYPRSGPGWVCLYPCCDGGAADFDVPGRLRGPGSSYLAHIQAATGSAARVAGRGCGAAPEAPEPLHLRLDCGDPAKLEEGRK